MASRNIALGERLISEAPLIEHTPDSPPLSDLVDALPEESRAAFFELAQNSERFGEKKTAEGIYATNALPNHAYSISHGAIFATISRFNHSCDANACFKWNPALGRMTVHASRPIRADEEITFNYGFPNGCVLRDARKRRLQSTFGFDCKCSKCSLTGEALRASEQRLAAIGDTSTLLDELCVWGSLPTLVCVPAEQVLRRLDARMELVSQEYPHGHCRGLDAFLKNYVEFCEAGTRSPHASLEPRSMGSPAYALPRLIVFPRPCITAHNSGFDAPGGCKPRPPFRGRRRAVRNSGRPRHSAQCCLRVHGGCPAVGRACALRNS